MSFVNDFNDFIAFDRLCRGVRALIFIIFMRFRVCLMVKILHFITLSIPNTVRNYIIVKLKYSSNTLTSEL